MTIDDLARRVGLPVRTIREYHTLRVLPHPQRKGRIGLYDAGHVQRLELIARLQRRGYSLAGIRDLLDAWDTGTELTALLGVGRIPVTLDETPLLLTRGELFDRLPGLDAAMLRRAEDTGLVRAKGPSSFLVRSPALLDFAADGVRAGVSLGEMVDLVGVLATGIDATARAVARSIADRIWPPMLVGSSTEDLPGLLARGRLLLQQGAVSLLADRLGGALLDLADDIPTGAALRAAIERARVGAVTDSAGALQHDTNRPG